MLEVLAVPVLTDNYVWLTHDPESGETAAVDPSVAAPVLDAAAANGLRLTQVLNTHWHPDHTGGNEAIRAATGSPIIAPAEAERVSKVDRIVAEGDRVSVCGAEAVVWDIPAHTAGHVAYYFEKERMIFVGDTMFAMGCGRLFEGTAEQMYANMLRIASLPDDVRIYCGHEYTLANARFALHAEPVNEAVRERLRHVEALRNAGEITLPTTVAEERATNPFVRASDAQDFARLRAEKDSFR
ncbi:hydroxyacylglutathione hydrolase [Sphingomonas sp. SM33]|uniref:Hydroxyacylglutathione hydrolase n=1 Tax=Sphingomonas telluris TaxID=2907998 RepID=A0ABS9VPW0_9SPHN|nr:hydroxyacylglutathione hydrolase [Sphingomonas telluris]MCH8617006.1 hydroxyacylglutathione hydrolase [Sphingomonas telluris]